MSAREASPLNLRNWLLVNASCLEEDEGYGSIMTRRTLFNVISYRQPAIPDSCLAGRP